MRDETVYKNFTALIIAGGKSTRMKGVDKLMLPIGDSTMLERVIDAVRPLFHEVIVACGQVGRYSELQGVRTVSDCAQGLGPIGGLRAGLAACSTNWAFVTAGDMPFVSQALVLRIARAANSRVKAVVPSHGETLEPLHAAYHRDLIPVIDRLISERRLGVHNLAKEATAHLLNVSDKEMHYLVNINRPEDLSAATETVEDRD